MISRHKAFHLLFALMLCLSLVQLSPLQASAADGKVVVGGLNYPRYMAMDDAGNIYVTEPGLGGDEKLPADPNDPESGGTRGLSGQVIKISPSGTKTVIAMGLPSYNTSEGSTGPEGIVLAGNSLYITTVTAFSPLSPLPYEGMVLKIDISSGYITKVADLGAFEKSKNPDLNLIDSDPYGLAMGPDGMLYAADAAGNDLLKVNPSTGTITLVAVFAGLTVPGFPFPPGGNPDRGGKAELDPVPTGVTVASDGTVYVGFLSGGPFPKGAAKVVKVTPDGKVSDVATGFTMIQGVAIGPDEKLYVSELTASLDFSKTPPDIQPGRVSRVNSDGSHTVVVDGLMFPSGIAFDKAGNLLVSTGTAFGPPNIGTITRYDGIASAPATGPLPNTGPVPGQLNFAITGYSLGGAFLNFWLANGSLGVFGYPIDSERMSDGVVAQWMERNRFELHPELRYPYNVLLGRLGAESLAQRGIDWATLPKVSSAPVGCRYFAETGHSLCGDFLNYLNKNGLEFDGQPGKTVSESLALFGFPISEPKIETNSSGDTVLTQWFERARFEFHPNNPAQYQVLLGLVGTEVKTGNRLH